MICTLLLRALEKGIWLVILIALSIDLTSTPVYEANLASASSDALPSIFSKLALLLTTADTINNFSRSPGKTCFNAWLELPSPIVQSSSFHKVATLMVPWVSTPVPEVHI